MQASIVAPIVALIGLILQLAFGIDLADEQLEIITNGLVALSLAFITIVGGYKAYKEGKSEE